MILTVSNPARPRAGCPPPADEKRVFLDASEGGCGDYSYEQMLDRIMDMLNANNPELMEKRRHTMKPPQLMRVGTKKTLWVNFSVRSPLLLPPPLCPRPTRLGCFSIACALLLFDHILREHRLTLILRQRERASFICTVMLRSRSMFVPRLLIFARRPIALVALPRPGNLLDDAPQP